MTPVSSSSVPAPRVANGALASLSLSSLLSSLGTSVANIALPELMQVFRAPMAQVQWVVIAYLLVLTATVIGVGRVGDMIGRRRWLLTGVLLFTLASLGCGLAANLTMLIAARIAQGLGAAIMMAMTLALAGETVDKASLGRAIGRLGAMSAVGTALGPTLGGVLLAYVGWPALFLVNVPLGLLTLWLAARCLPVAPLLPDERKAGFDVAGTLWLSGTLVAYALAMTPGVPVMGEATRWLLLAAVGGLFGFIRVERRVASPLIRLEMLRSTVMAGGLATSLLVAAVMMTTLVVGPFYLRHTLGLDAMQTGLVMSVGPMAAALTGVVAGRWVDQMGTMRMTMLGLALVTGGCGALSVIPYSGGILGYVLPMLSLTAGYALFQTANNTSLMKTVLPTQRGLVSGILNLSRNLGLITGAAMMGALFARTSSVDLASLGAMPAMTALAGAVSGGMRTTFQAATLLALITLPIAWFSLRRRSD
ncbi:MFS transporter [Dickeya dianthicola]|uniref:MFS transporter n=1 Tax=Dickeya dianthicola TaxID=204039 RepID=UPI00136F946B|nr:MFS transporter [Dickeya dianthicola]MCI4237129.1 MFS transporter [Dickeya dianthicola]MCI4256057.1 MFS transporter [Dickeya dianthicola]MZG23696.1 MFS transporter [Dickeya dianthicola]